MKRHLLLAALLLLGVTAQAQMIGATNNQRTTRTTPSSSGNLQNSIGVCLSGEINRGGEFGLSSIWQLNRNRIEVNLMFRGVMYEEIESGFILNTTYQWTWSINHNWKWYAGLGGCVGYLWGEYGDYNIWRLGIIGQVGIEYNLPELPLQFTFDLHPTFSLTEGRISLLFGGLGVRYRF